MNPITGHTKLTALLGSPVSHSISPLMHNEAFRKLGLDYVYLCFDVNEHALPEAVAGLRSCGIRGFNLTMPDKNKMVELADELSPAARLIGAVNTVVNEKGRLIGHNTDGIGYMQSVRDTGYDVSGGEMVLLGAGGAASSIAIQAALDGVPALHIVNRRGRSWENACRLADQINKHTGCRADVTDMADGKAVRSLILRSRLLTNATSVGMAPHIQDSPLSDTSCFHPDLLVSDIIYNPRRTKFLKDAEACGCRTANGLYMLLYQGAAAFHIWTGHEMPVEQIRKMYFS